MTHLKVFEEARSQRNLDDIEIQSPCDVPWDSLRGTERVRACGRCRENVYNISAMTRVEALRLIRATEGRICVRIHRRPDGTVVTGDCWSRLRAARKRGMLVFAGALVVVGCLQLVAMLVGLRGLRTLVGGPVMGGVPAAAQRELVPMMPPSRIEEPEMGEWTAFPQDEGTMGGGRDEHETPARPRRPEKRKKAFASGTASISLGRMRSPRHAGAK